MCTILPRGYEMDTGGNIRYTGPRLVVEVATSESKPVGICADHSFCTRCRHKLAHENSDTPKTCLLCGNREQYVWVQMINPYL